MSTTRPRQVAVALPFMLTHDGPRFLVVSSRKHANAWIFPKGGIEHGEDASEAAAREAWEEAGIKGIPIRKLLTSTDSHAMKRSSTVDESSPTFVPKAVYTFYALRVAEDGIFDTWPESHERERRWVSEADARSLVKWRNDGQVDALAKLVATDLLK